MEKTDFIERRPGAWAGILAPVLFLTICAIQINRLRPEYQPLRLGADALALGPLGWIQTANLIVLGLLLLPFARCVAAEFSSRRGGPLLLTILSLLTIVSGLLVMDPPGTPWNQASLHGLIHNLAGVGVLVLMPLSCFVFLRSFHLDADWRSFQGWTLGLGIIVAVAVGSFAAASMMQGVLSDWVGLIQRLAILPYLLWLFLFALRLRSLAARRNTRPRAASPSGATTPTA